MMMNQVEKDIVERFGGKADGEGVNIYVAFSHNEDVAKEFVKEIKERFPKSDPLANALSLSVSCHIGPGAIAIACSKVEKY